MKMREFVDQEQGEGAWDEMHDLIEDMQLFGWIQPEVMVELDDGSIHRVAVFPGTNKEVTVEEVKNEIKRVLTGISNGDIVPEYVDSFEDYLKIKRP